MPAVKGERREDTLTAVPEERKATLLKAVHLSVTSLKSYYWLKTPNEPGLYSTAESGVVRRHVPQYRSVQEVVPSETESIQIHHTLETRFSLACGHL
jgi:hypothetical protein